LEHVLHIMDIRPEPYSSGSTIALFDVQLTPDIRLFNLKLIENPRGRRVHAPKAFCASVATFSPALAEQLTRAASAALAGVNAGVRDAA